MTYSRNLNNKTPNSMGVISMAVTPPCGASGAFERLAIKKMPHLEGVCFAVPQRLAWAAVPDGETSMVE